MKKEYLKGLSEEQIAKAKACKNSDEIIALAKAEGVELTEEQLEAVSGGFCSTPSFVCPECGCKDVSHSYHSNPVRRFWACTCKQCGYYWTE